jgi:hypothetical protein
MDDHSKSNLKITKKNKKIEIILDKSNNGEQK